MLKMSLGSSLLPMALPLAKKLLDHLQQVLNVAPS